MKPYKSLEQQIRELWASRGLNVLEERFESVGENKYKWIIIAEEIRYKKTPLQALKEANKRNKKKEG